MSSDQPVFVPMLVDAYVNYGQRLQVASTDRAYLAPITTPNYQSLQLGTGLLQHDIFDDLRDAPYLASADRYRVVDSRRGIYVHWSMPKHYRHGIMASESGAEAMVSEKVRAGFKNPTSVPGKPEFHQVPTRWVVARRITGLSNGPPSKSIPVQRQDAAGNVKDNFYKSTAYESQTPPYSALFDLFVLESDCVRNIKDIPSGEDVEVTASPYSDYDIPPTAQGQTFLGRRTKLTDWTPDAVPPPRSRISLTVNRSANPFFADYQPQNGSVFSFFDDLSFVDDIGPGYFSNVSVSYAVFGYHTTADSDPLVMTSNTEQNSLDRLAALNLEPMYPATANALANASSMTTICHGQFYNIPWQNPLRPHTPSNLNFPADDIQKQFRISHPVSVGTNALDAMFGWLTTIPDGTAGGLPPDEGMPAQVIKKNLTRIQTLLLDLNDDLDSQLQAGDLLATNNFISSPQGTRWQFRDQGTSFLPTSSQVDALRTINEQQTRLNALLREQRRLKRELFDLWWTYACDRHRGDTKYQANQRTAASKAVSSKVTAIKANLDLTNRGVIQTLSDQIDQQITALGPTVELKQAAEPAFYMQRDPTLFIAGLASAWPRDWNQKLKVRAVADLGGLQQDYGPPVPGQRPPPHVIQDPELVFPISTGSILRQKMPSAIQTSTVRLMEEFSSFVRSAPDRANAPEYYMSGDRFEGKNAWFPLFIEWEIEYYHIPFALWEFAPQGPEGRVGYGVALSQNIATASIQGDIRVINGRCPIVPQASSILETTIRQALDRVGAASLPEDFDQDAVKTQARNLDTVSTPLTGLTTQLTTRMLGTHMRPFVYNLIQVPVWVPGAESIGQELGISVEDMSLVGDETSTTPFASITPIKAGPTYSPFKPCTHGQFRFSKLNIVDKFGQVVQGIGTTSDPKNGIGPTRMPLFPCLGEAYSVHGDVNDASGDGTSGSSGVGFAKTIFPRNDQFCEFVQLPPSINQNARINAEFLIDYYDESSSMTRLQVAEEWDDPVRGWLVINYANASLQVFTSDGSFVQEFGALKGENGAPSLRPFGAQSSTYLDNVKDPFLRTLLLAFQTQGYLYELFATLTEAVAAIQASPSSFSESMLSLLGRPLALVCFGVSLELADPPLTNQSTLATMVSNQRTSITNYEFPIKIGDKDNIFDGLYGYCKLRPNPEQTIDPDVNLFRSYYSDTSTPNQYWLPIDLYDIRLNPFYADPHDASGMTTQRLSNTTVISAIVDPFAPVHFYSALLPIKSLQIPSFAVSNGVARICSFFKMGPLLVPADVPDYDPTKAVRQDYRLGDDGAPTSNGSVQIPAVALGDWAWLQPYSEDGAVTNYNLLDVVANPDKPQWLPAPYVAVEGFLQQKQPFQPPSAAG